MQVNNHGPVQHQTVVIDGRTVQVNVKHLDGNDAIEVDAEEGE